MYLCFWHLEVFAEIASFCFKKEIIESFNQSEIFEELKLDICVKVLYTAITLYFV